MSLMPVDQPAMHQILMEVAAHPIIARMLRALVVNKRRLKHDQVKRFLLKNGFEAIRVLIADLTIK